MNKKLFTIPFLLILLALGIVACGSETEEETVDAVETAVVEETAVAPTTDPASTETDESTTSLTYPIVDTDQTWCFSDSEAIACGDMFVGQDAQYEGLQPAYQDNGDGTITDLNTGLMWIQDAGEKKYYADAIEELETYTFAGYDDWRLPTIKELYSLALFSGVDASMASSSDVDGLWPLIDDDYFVFLYGDESGSNRVIDAQWLTSNVYVSTVNNGQSCFFGFNFSDGRIKCYGLENSPAGGYFAQYVRGGDDYGVNDFVENGNDTITDNATGLTWTQNDSAEALDYDSALNYCESLSLDGSDEWRLPNIKELHSLVDYSRSPDTTNSAAIDPLFNMIQITNEAGEPDYGSYWSSTTLISYPSDVSWATYISFGRALGYMEEFGGWVDVHGAGAQRSDPKVPGEAYEFGHGPQGDAVRQYNYALCVSGGVAEPSDGADPSTLVLANPENFVPADINIPAGNAPEETGSGETPDLAAAAATLGVTEQELIDALGTPPPDFEAAAETLGITVEELQAALGVGAAPEGDAQAPPEDATEAAAPVDIGDGRLFAIPGDNVFPEGVSYDEATGKFYVGSTTDGTLYEGDVNGDLEMTLFSEGGADGRMAAVGTKVDGDGRLWVAGGGTGQVFVYDTADGSHVATITTPASDATFINDLAITENGVYFTDSFRPILWRVTDVDQGEAEAWLDFTGTALTYVDGFNLNGIVPTEDGSSLIVIHSGEGALYRIDVATQEVTQIDTGAAALTAGDGLALIDNTIYVTRNSFGEILPLELEADLSTAAGGTAITSDLFGYPTTIAYTGDSFLVANSQFNNRGAPNLPFTVAQIPLAQSE